MANEAFPFAVHSYDGRFGLRIPAKEMSTVLKLCDLVRENETGGILIGYYNDQHNRAVVVEITGAPTDSRSGRNWFLRGLRGLPLKLARLWKLKGLYYLGEWHFHPGIAAVPSSSDVRQMKEISNSDHYSCPEPVLLLIGGESGAYEMKALVFPRGEPMLSLSMTCLLPKTDLEPMTNNGPKTEA